MLWNLFSWFRNWFFFFSMAIDQWVEWAKSIGEMIPAQWTPPCNSQCTHKYAALMQIPCNFIFPLSFETCLIDSHHSNFRIFIWFWNWYLHLLFDWASILSAFVYAGVPCSSLMTSMVQGLRVVESCYFGMKLWKGDTFSRFSLL